MTDITQLKPYKSLIIAKAENAPTLSTLIQEILDDLMECLEIDLIPQCRLVDRLDGYSEGDLAVGFLHYQEECQPSWTIEETIRDTLNHLVVVCGKGHFVTIYMSDSKRKHLVTNRILQPGDHGLSCLELISQGLLNAAFVKGPARTLWLSGTHRRTSIKPDNKILTGLDLRDALDPLGDQTYHFTAARCLSESLLIPEPVGISPRKSQVWIGPSKNWSDYCFLMSRLLALVENTTTPTRAPLPIVAISSPDASQLSGLFDMALLPPELLADDPHLDRETREEMELWGYESNFEILEASGYEFISEVSLKGQVLGKIKFKLNPETPEQVSWTVEESDYESSQEEAYRKVLKLVQKKGWVKFWFESGHTISDGEIFEVRHRDMPFDDFVWANLSGYEVKKEKPDPLDEHTIGTQRSLFDWMLNYWPNIDQSKTDPGGWLASDDGSMEIADFIQLDDRARQPVLTLVHVKASGNDDPHRTVSVSDYEVVTSQAVKNLRHLDSLLLTEGLKEGIGKKIGKLVWHDQVLSDRQEMITALSKVGLNCQRRVFVFQPRLTKTMYDQTRLSNQGSDFSRLRQLDTLLLSAAASCRGLCVEFKVIGEKI